MKYKLMKALALVSFSSFNLFSMHNNFEQQWADMQAQYIKLCTALDSDKFRSMESDYCGSYWQGQKKEFRNTLLGKANKNLWREHCIQSSMVRTGFDSMQALEVCYIKSCISEKTRNKILSYKDVDFNSVPFECELNCSTNTLGHLFYTAKVLEKVHQNNIKLNTIFEFGGGYGNLGRILKSLNPQATLVMIDLPEFNALQYLFLKATLPYEVIVHTEAPKSFKEGAIHLVPVFFLKDIDLNADLFISTFALSEAPLMVQSIVADKKFFNATIAYLTGQLNGWAPHLDFEHHKFIHSQIRSTYSIVDCVPFHGNLQLGKGFESYEIVGLNQK